MQFYDSFNDLAAGAGAEPLLSDMSVFNLGIKYADSEIEKICTADEQTQLKFLKDADKVRELNKRLAEMRAADTVRDLDTIGVNGRYHAMKKGYRAERGEITGDISARDRLVFVPATPPPIMPNGEPDYRKVTDVIIIKIDDPHNF